MRIYAWAYEKFFDSLKVNFLNSDEESDCQTPKEEYLSKYGRS